MVGEVVVVVAREALEMLHGRKKFGRSLAWRGSGNKRGRWRIREL